MNPYGYRLGGTIVVCFCFWLASGTAFAAGVTRIRAQAAHAQVCPPAASAATGQVQSHAHAKTPTTASSRAVTPASASGLPPRLDPPPPAYGGETITVHRNARDQVVYSISASHFDISPPLRELAAAASTVPEIEGEAPENPQLPSWRTLRSGVPDPVVQTEIPPADSANRLGIERSAPTTGFNFAGVGSTGASPSDNNGSVGNNQYVETVNTRYQVWSLDRGTRTATSVLGPANINTLWSGFGGACQAQNDGDPIVLFDKVAGRWLISQLTFNPDAAGLLYECVAVSTTADAAGTYARYAFAFPTDPATGDRYFGDYPHLGVWGDAYYMMAHGFSPTGFVGAVFAAMDRPRMLAGNPAATFQVLLDATEGGHMPADLDGFAPPPTNAPGIFLSIHNSGMFIYRMKVDFATPANTATTLQATVPVAPSTGACQLTGGPCIPQPGSTQLLDSLGDRLMFRTAYRNFIDHESLVVTHSVDPSIAGVEAGVRWYDFRLSGQPDATCATYPCLYQQGTIADTPNGRSRWMGSAAMDAAENILVGYSVSGKVNLSENHTIRYTGRAKGDPPGVMTAPEVTIATANRNEGNASRWGDYSSMSVDPFDDCTFWYVNQYYNGMINLWSTRIASAAWPAGSGPGQCPAAACTARPASAPGIGAATVPGNNQIRLIWTGIAPAPGAYAIERAVGACGSEGLYQPLAAVPGTATSFTDTTVLGGFTYSYRVIAAADPAGRCQALVASGCASATATGNCNLRPGFAGATSAASSGSPSCGINVNWSPATTSCPLTANMRYNIFRGTVPDFAPAASNRIATCVAGTTYLDSNNLSSGVTYFYVVRAEDNSTGNGGACGGGNEDANGIVVPGTAYGAGTQATAGTWSDGGGDRTAFLLLNAAGPGNTSDPVWRFVTTANDAGANHTPAGSYAYRNAGPAATNVYLPDVCAEMHTPPLSVGAPALNLQYWERHQIEYHWDGVAVEYSRNGGAWTSVPPPSNSAAASCAAGDVTSDWQGLECTQVPPINACGYPIATSCYNGPFGSGADCTTYATGATVTSYGHRCHQVTGLTAGDTIQFRWRFSSDAGAEFAGFYLDDIAVSNIRLPNACTPGVACSSPAGLGAPAASDAGPCASTPGINVSWTAPAAWGDTSGTRTYSVLRDGLPIPTGACSGSLPSSTMSCVDVPGDTNPHSYAIIATNGCGASLTSAASGSASDSSDGTAPNMTILYAVEARPNVVFSWASAEAGATYTTYRTTTRPFTWTSQNATAALSWTNTTDLGSPTSYYYSTTAGDACGNESAP